MATHIVKKDGLEIIYTDTITVVKYESLLIVMRTKQKNYKLLEALPENIQRAVKSVIERIESSNQ